MNTHPMAAGVAGARVLHGLQEGSGLQEVRILGSEKGGGHVLCYAGL